MNHVEVIEVFIGDDRIGRIALTKQGLCAFEYDALYLQSGTSISPLELPLRTGVMLAKRTPFEGNFGVFDDCLPDGWGLLVLDRYLQKKGINQSKLTLLDRLSLVGASGRGALEFRPDQSIMRPEEIVDFELLANETQKILKTENYQGESIESLYRQGGSPGGARPKIFTKFDNKEWLVKFRSGFDPEEVGEIEFEYSLLAKKCGVEMPETRLFENKFFGVERFDRTTNGKLHVVSVAGLLNADYRLPCIDYLTIFQLCQMLTHNMQDIWKLYRLMVFNYLIANKDDHAKNFAFILKDREWHLSPAFDILRAEGMNGSHTTSINNKISPTEVDVLAVAEKSGLDRNKALNVLTEMKEVVNNSEVVHVDCKNQ